MTTPVQTRLDEEELAALDRAVASGRFANRSEALRAGLSLVLRDERDRQIEAAYRHGYTAIPQEPWVGEVGMTLLGAAARAEANGEPL